MKLVRTFYPVGHGAFYTERFYQNDPQTETPLFTAVFDCGSITSTSILYNQIAVEFKTYKDVDVVFLSHFHEDHINGINYLLSNCNVHNIVIPALPKEFKICAMVYNALRWGSRNLSNDLITSLFENILDTNIIPIDESNDGIKLNNILPEALRNAWKYQPLLLPCYSKTHTNNINRFIGSLKQDTTFKGIFNAQGNICFSSLNQLLKNSQNINHLRGLLSRCSLNGNQYNMVIGSESTNLNQKVGCLFTGDAMLACPQRMSLLKQTFLLNTLYDYVQVPHHGVKGDNHNADLYQSIKKCIISVKDRDPQRPSPKVLNNILYPNGGIYTILTENSQKQVLTYSL